jgi:hypothetical protein
MCKDPAVAIEVPNAVVRMIVYVVKERTSNSIVTIKIESTICSLKR